jgi:Phosphotransferase enzyme family
VFGSACPPRLRPVAAARDAANSVDLALLAPTQAECEQDDWLGEAVSTCAEHLAPDGLVYALLPRRLRARAGERLTAAGLVLESPILHLPDAATSEHLIPLEPAPAGHAFASIVPVVPWKRAAIRALLSFGGRRVLSSRLKGVALIARREGARPLVDWLPVPGVPAGARRSVIVSAAWRGNGASVVLHPFGPGARPPVVAKLALGSKAAPAAEESRLARLGPAAARAGAVVPLPLARASLDSAPVLVETRVEGRILAPLLGRRPARLSRTLTRLCDWLDAWGRLTATRTPITQRQVEREVLAPARALAPHLDGGAAYVAALEARCASATGQAVQLVASHNDLTMWNVLVDGGGRLGIVDWEVAEEGTLPLKDFFYAVVDAVAATRRYADRPAAARACFGPGGEHADRVRDAQASLASSVDVAPEIVELSFHACWLGHAANELGKVGASDPAPFREIVQWLAQREAGRQA